MSKFEAVWFRPTAIAVCVALPWLVLAAFLIVMHGSLTDMFPVWSDEISLYKQVEALLCCGGPEGYYGYAGSQATVGTGGPWGQATVWPYAAFGSVFGWHPFTPVLANTTFASLGLLGFILLTRPRTRDLPLLAAVYAGCYSMHFATITGMSEPLRVSLALVMVALLYRLTGDRPLAHRPRLSNVLVYGLTPLVIVYAAQVYAPLSVGLGIYAFLLLGRVRLSLRLLAAVGVTLVLAGVTYAVLGLLAPAYLVSHLADVLGAFRAGPVQGIGFFLTGAGEHLLELNQGDFREGVEPVIVFQYQVLLILVVASLRRVRTGRDRAIVCFTAVLLASIYLFCVFLYTGFPSTAVRQLTIALVPSLILFVLMRRKLLVTAFLVLAVATLPSAVATFPIRGVDRFLTAEAQTSRAELASALAETIKIDSELDPWENTIGMYGAYSPVYLTVPAGSGLNYYGGAVGESPDRRPRYAMVVAVTSGYRQELRQSLERVGYRTVLTKSSVVLLVRS